MRVGKRRVSVRLHWCLTVVDKGEDGGKEPGVIRDGGGGDFEMVGVQSRPESCPETQ